MSPKKIEEVDGESNSAPKKTISDCEEYFEKPEKSVEELNAHEEKLCEDREQFDQDIKVCEERLQQDLEQFQTDQLVEYYGETNPSEVLSLNIGGTKVKVSRKTLTCVPGSMLASKFSGRWDDSIERDDDGNFIIDHDF